ncbi:electron transfer flavoprotein subunit alpha [Desulfosarcina ovata]|uniref:Electron transfer flavoprotein subunit alpha n=1 Tax=Desulfosarcina ovata subsp. ovata TaxID=2752305 RepID=A0A5K8AGK4_9BACT|nr:electron transfer flavoprotein subunit alpha [Desulfosarcina ovata]BBO91823.1 electron transfer flavoprotein subunit alpha [Desulfosarcina ovata subsp. ovata]
MTVWIESDLCDGCRRCVRACPYDAIAIEDGKANILERCTNCGACLAECKNRAIQSDAVPKEIPDFSDHEGVWVYAEQRDGVLAKVTLELLGIAQELGQERRQKVSAVLIGDRLENLTHDLIRHGADQVFLAEDPCLQPYRTLAHVKIMEDLINEHKPEILLIGATHIGRDLAPRLSRRVGVGLTADCTALSIDPEEKILLQTRPAFGGNVMATIANRYSRPQMATVRPGVMEARTDEAKAGTIIHCEVQLDEADIKTKVLEMFEEKRKHAPITDSKVIVAGGRGVNGEAGFQMLRTLADLLDGEVAGTRVVAEQGFVPADCQVGQTGKTVRPEIYIACGISGAIQHRAGMMNSRFIIAINKDPDAPIFKVADWGIIGDLHDVVPELVRQLTPAS